MLSSMSRFLDYFDAVNRRAMRDVGALPPEADGWAPPAGEGENGWDINTLVGHMAGSRLYFANAFLGRGWISPPPPVVSTRERWVPALEESANELRRLLAGAPYELLRQRVKMIDTDGTLSGWRVLMMMVEHDIHHRSQIDTYAGLNGWDVPQIFGRRAEQIGALQPTERAKHGLGGEGYPL